MAQLTVSSPAKINLHLEVLGQRSDGFHELAMVMQTIDLADTLRFKTTADGQIQLECSRPDLPTDASNLVVRAGELLRARSGFPELGAHIQLDKRIPIGAGLAGGSSNGAAALLGLNRLWGLGFEAPELTAMAAELGSDMPFCMAGGTQLCFGRGELLEPVLPAAADTLAVLLIKQPEAHVSTPWAYGRSRELRGDFYLSEEQEFAQRRDALRQNPLLAQLAEGRCPPRLRNDLQQLVEPEVESVRGALALLAQLSNGSQTANPQLSSPLTVAMSGSGPSCFALFADLGQATAAHGLLANALETAGFEAWCCSFNPVGVSLI
ncbi:4-(cytidine 5'-diphospho)-2-C-methyl-D-erythritol kinase [Cyanobium sp. WAJ14-Wanaka]|uniref:4-(cytidine 5'-diphospho)-2-C-methyl-D-erythritol kinase n=1 Tax=Cyanobium sp. WAJ14-Wanaka TaxID=2823725 RepID=UPI0020CC79DA|nr:4-(cytidine 5'-diphospho)-2-C-methyl-D-erythritol kinase [Cyanobium sp. WAJ14-Wanaka]MCP9774628.1 4-(cytidine 5'-diphospho)-2-C-methyl-D-erythritol kinase [Cyanobium sp. WAJ14-Wanaka]